MRFYSLDKILKRDVLIVNLTEVDKNATIFKLVLWSQMY